MNLEDLGWNEFFQEQLRKAGGGALPARVKRQDSDGYQLLWHAGEVFGVLRGKLRHDSASRAQLPTVGDWVLVDPIRGDEEQVFIHTLLTRKSAFSRKEAGERTDEQVLAANIDTVFIVAGLDGNFSRRRIERYLLLATSSGAEPVILLTKLDLCDDPESAISEIRRVEPAVPIVAVSALTGEGMKQLDPYLAPGATLTLLGSSGVGKSSIVNRLLGTDRFETTEVRKDSKGRHTTTWREMVILPSGCLIIDTPGMRELQLWADDSALSDSFGDIEQLADECRYRDCAHRDEPGCAVKDAALSGALEPERLASYLRFKGEIERLARQQALQARSVRNRDRGRSGRGKKPESG